MSAPVLAAHWARIADRHDPGAYGALERGYGDPARSYHDWSHIADLLTKLDGMSNLAARPDLIAAAIFWHDSVFITRTADGAVRSDADNVRDSADLFERHARFPAAETAAVREMIMATANHLTATPQTIHYSGFAQDMDLFLDLDLSSLGAPWPVFRRNFEKIRSEYPWIDAIEFDRQRLGMLEKFAACSSSVFRLAASRTLWSAPTQENCLLIRDEILQRLRDFQNNERFNA